MDRYEKLKTIGRGQYGEAMLCRTVGGSHEKVVVKRVSIELMNRIERKQALAEVTFLSTLKHPNVVDYRESFMYGEDLHIVMEYCAVGDLSAYIKAAKQPLEEALILDWFIQLCMACRYIHSRKILHRDLKSNNVFITDRSIIKLGDFGIARVLSSTLDHASTVVGTPYYMSPEVCENKPYVCFIFFQIRFFFVRKFVPNKFKFFFLKYFSKIHTYKSDLWAVGCILYEMCARCHAFKGSNLLGLVYQIVQGKYTSLPKGYSQGMRGLVSSLLKKNPNQRADYAKIFSAPIIRNQIAELERTGGSIGQKLRKVSKMNSKRNKINKNKISESKVNGQSEQRHLLVMLTPAERARRRKQRSKDLARELREAELKAVTLSVGTKNRNAVAERKRRMFRSSTGSGLNFAADCNVESKLNEKSKDTMNTITITSMTAAGSKNIHLGQNKEPFGNSDDPFPMSDLSTASLSCTKFGPDSNLNLPSDTLAKTETDASLYASIEFNPDVTLSPTNSSSSPNHNGFRRSVDYVSTKDGKDPFNETYFRESSNPDEQFVLVHGKESQNNRNERGQRIIRRHDPNDDRPIHGSIGGKYKVNDSAGVDEIPTVNEEKPIFEAKSQSAKYMAHIEAKNKGSNFSYITDSKQKYAYKRPSYLINPDERPINPSPRGSCYSPYDEIDAHVPVISPGTAGTAAAVAVLESQSLPGDPGSPVTMFSFDSQFASNNNSNIGRGSSKSFGGRGHRRSLSGRGGRQRTSIRVGGRGGRSSPEAKQRSTNINGIPSSSIDTSPSKEKSLAQNTVDEKQSTRNEGYLTNVDKKNGSVIRPSSPSYMDSGDDDDMYSDEDEAGGLYSDDFENDGKTQVDDDAIEVLAQLRHITIGGEASAAVAVSDLPEGDHTPLLGINYEQIERFQNDLRSREGVLYTDIRKFLLHNQKHKDTKTILEDKFGREKLDFCFEVEQLLYLERHCTPSARNTNEK